MGTVDIFAFYLILLFIISPTIILCLILFTTAVQTLRGRLHYRWFLFTSVILCVFFASWFIARNQALAEHEKPDQLRDRVALQDLNGKIPEDLVILANTRDIKFIPKDLPVKRIFLKNNGCSIDSNRGSYIVYQKTPKGWKEIQKTPILSDRYLLNLNRKCKQFDKDHTLNGGSPWVFGGPFELRLITPKQNSFISFYYKRYTRIPTWPPLLTIHGWRGEPNSATYDEKWIHRIKTLERELNKLCKQPAAAC